MAIDIRSNVVSKADFTKVFHEVLRESCDDASAGDFCEMVWGGLCDLGYQMDDPAVLTDVDIIVGLILKKA